MTTAKCLGCGHSRTKRWYGTPLPSGQLACAHPVMRAPCPLVSGERPFSATAAAALKIVGPLGKEAPNRERFLWPWNFDPDLLQRCEGFEKKGF